MASLIEIMQLCRLCLVKDQVNIPIFEEQGDVRQIFLKLAACFPTVQVSRDDNLPKKICESCMFKLEHSYQFWSLTTNAEKQLNVWLKQIGLDANSKVVGQQSLQMVAQSHAHPHSLETETVILKQEAIDPIDVRPDIGVSSDTQSYILQQQQLPYQPVGFQYEQPPAFSQPSTSSNTGPSATVTSATNEPAMLGKRKRRQVITNPIPSSEESDDDEDIQPPKIAKEEEDSDSADDNEPLQPTAFVSVPAISQDAEQPGPSGLNKPTAGSTSEAPFLPCHLLVEQYLIEDGKSKQEIKTENVEGCDTAAGTGKGKGGAKKESKFKYHRIGKTAKLKQRKVSDILDENDSASANQCDICSQEFTTSTKLQNHLRMHNMMPYFCEVCKMCFEEPLDYSFHQRKHNSANEPLECPLCGHKTQQKGHMEKHIATHHTNNFKYRCETCGKGFHMVRWYEEHQNEHAGIKPYICDVCGKGYFYSRYLIVHKTTSHRVSTSGVPEKYKCKICDREYIHKNSLQHHLRTHSGQHAVLCDFCGKQFSSKDKLRLHHRIHTGYKPYSCRFCNKTFTKREYLVMHERVHTGEKPYTCEYCGKRFNQRCSLTMHKRGHTGERPYICHLCNNGFISRAVLKMHLPTCNGS